MARKRSGRIGGVEADVRTYGLTFGAGKLVTPQGSQWHQLVYATGGALHVELLDTSWAVPAHRAVWLPAGVPYELRLLSQVDLRMLYLDTRLMPRAPAAPCTVNVSPLLRELILFAVTKGALRRAVPLERSAITLLVDQLEFIADVPLQLPLPVDGRARRLAELLIANPSSSRTLAQLARKVGAAVRTLERAFAADVGMTFAEWRRRLRMKSAIERLARGDSVTAAALDAGYDSVSAFIAAFRRELGTTPGRWLAKGVTSAVA